VRWGVFLIFAILAVAVDTSITGALSIRGVVPSVSPLLAAFIALSAPPLTAMWACLLIGLLLDFTNPGMIGSDQVFHLIGPYALGYLFAANLVLPLRAMVFRRNPMTLGVFAGTFVVAAGLVYTMIWSIRGLYDPAPIVFGGRTALHELLNTLLRAVYTGALGVPLGWILARTAPLWGFTSSSQRFGRW